MIARGIDGRDTREPVQDESWRTLAGLTLFVVAACCGNVLGAVVLLLTACVLLFA